MSGLEDAVIEAGDEIARGMRMAGEDIASSLNLVAVRLQQLNETIHQAELARQADAAAARDGRKGKAK